MKFTYVNNFNDLSVTIIDYRAVATGREMRTTALTLCCLMVLTSTKKL